jgi:hypothetical protein
LEYRDSRHCKFPSCPITESSEGEENPYKIIGLRQYSLIYTYFGIPIDKQLELDVLTFNMLLRDSLCMRLAETEEGNNYLEDCFILQQTNPDRKQLKERFS